MAKANALLHRSAPASSGAITSGKIMLQPGTHKVYLDGQELTLTHKEYELLLPADFILPESANLKCEKLLTLPVDLTPTE